MTLENGLGKAVVTATAVDSTTKIYTVNFTIAEEPASATFTITFDANGGSVSESTAETETDGRLSELPVPTRGNDRFDGWYTAAEGGDRVTTDTVFGEAATVYAHWTYAGSTSGDDGSDSDSDPTYRFSTEKAENGSVKLSVKNASEDSRVTVTVTPDAGYELTRLLVTDENGKAVKVTLKNAKYMFNMPKGAVSVKATFKAVSAFRFDDVADGHWAEESIYWAYGSGLMTGKTANTIVSRQQVWMILGRHCGYEPADMTAAKAWAVAYGISDGTNPGNAVTRQQLVALLYRYAGMMEYDVDDRADLSGYSDCEAVSDYAREAMSWAVANGIVSGTVQNTLNSHGTATRAQFAAIMTRFCGKIA